MGRATKQAKRHNQFSGLERDLRTERQKFGTWRRSRDRRPRDRSDEKSETHRLLRGHQGPDRSLKKSLYAGTGWKQGPPPPTQHRPEVEPKVSFAASDVHTKLKKNKKKQSIEARILRNKAAPHNSAGRWLILPLIAHDLRRAHQSSWKLKSCVQRPGLLTLDTTLQQGGLTHTWLVLL